jgi:hypothetical protein
MEWMKSLMLKMIFHNIIDDYNYECFNIILN